MVSTLLTSADPSATERATKRRKGMPPWAQALELMEELVEEILLRLPPDDPAALVSAALVCKLWHRLVTGASFGRSFREFHCSRGRVPLLGVFYTGSDHCSCNRPHNSAYFVPTTSFRPAPSHPHANDDNRHRRPRWQLDAIDARHGRVLLYRHSANWRHFPRAFAVWNPVTGERRDLPELPWDDCWCRLTAAVVCAAGTGGSNCSHVDCHRGHFLVVVADMVEDEMHLSVYSSEADAWIKKRADLELVSGSFRYTPSVLVGDALHFLLHDKIDVKYDLATTELSKIRLPSRFDHVLYRRSIMLMTDDHGGLGLVASMDYEVELWSMVAGGNDDGDAAGFVLRRVIDLVRPFPGVALINKSPQVSGFVEAGASRFLFFRTPDGLYSMEINSREVKKVGNCCEYDKVVLPFVSFCIPTSRV